MPEQHRPTRRQSLAAALMSHQHDIPWSDALEVVLRLERRADFFLAMASVAIDHLQHLARDAGETADA